MNSPALFTITKENLNKRLLLSHSLNKPENTLIELNIDNLINFIKPTNNNELEFLSSPLAQGFITNEAFQELSNKFHRDQKAKKDWILLLLDSWLSAFYKVIWIEYRNSHLDFSQNPPPKKKKKRKLYKYKHQKKSAEIRPDPEPPPEDSLQSPAPTISQCSNTRPVAEPPPHNLLLMTNCQPTIHPSNLTSSQVKNLFPKPVLPTQPINSKSSSFGGTASSSS